MSLFLSYLIIPVVLLFLVLNVVFRIRILRKYQKLKAKHDNLQFDKVFSEDDREALISSLSPEDAAEVRAFAKHLRQLITIAIVGFALILILFLVVYFNQ